MSFDEWEAEIYASRMMMLLLTKLALYANVPHG
jgi:hypothetical protein